MQLIDYARTVPGLRLEAAGDLAELLDRGRHHGHGLGFFGQGVAGGGVGLRGIGLLVAEDGGAIVLVALRIAAGNGPGIGQAMQEGEQVVGGGVAPGPPAGQGGAGEGAFFDGHVGVQVDLGGFGRFVAEP